MNKFICITCIVFFAFQSVLLAQAPDYKNAKLPTEKRVDDLLK